MRRHKDQYADIKDYYKKKVFMPVIETIIFQIETRLILSKPHFKATGLLPANIDFACLDCSIFFLFFSKNHPTTMMLLNMGSLIHFKSSFTIGLCVGGI